MFMPSFIVISPLSTETSRHAKYVLTGGRFDKNINIDVTRIGVPRGGNGLCHTIFFEKLTTFLVIASGK